MDILSPMLLVLKIQKKQWGVLWRQLSRLVIFGEPSVGSVRTLSWCGRGRGDCVSKTWGSRAGAWALCGRRTAAGSRPWLCRMQAWSVASPCGREHVWGKESGGGKAGEDVQAGQTSYGDASSFHERVSLQAGGT